MVGKPPDLRQVCHQFPATAAKYMSAANFAIVVNVVYCCLVRSGFFMPEERPSDAMTIDHQSRR
jgi:hypothetical protein